MAWQGWLSGILPVLLVSPGALASAEPRPAGRQPLAAPDPAPRLVVMVKVLAADRGRPAAEEWIRKALVALGATGDVGVQADWFPLGAETVPLHDSKHFGQAALALRDPGDGKPLMVEISGSHPATVALARRAGEQRLVRHTIASSIASLDFYLAFRVEAAATSPGAPSPAPGGAAE